MAVWAKGLTRYGLHYAGIVDESQLDELLELHKRDTVSTVHGVTKKTAIKQKLTTDECSTRPSDDQPEGDQTDSDHTVSYSSSK